MIAYQSCDLSCLSGCTTVLNACTVVAVVLNQQEIDLFNR